MALSPKEATFKAVCNSPLSPQLLDHLKGIPLVRIMHPYRNCTRCAQLKPPEGGCQMHPLRWVCFACWKKLSRGNT
jgi:hypothetical protein